MGVYYTCACHTCRTYMPFEKWTVDFAHKLYEAWKVQHIDHDTLLTSDYDEIFDYQRNGWNSVAYVGYGVYKTDDKGEPYRMLSDEEVKNLCDAVRRDAHELSKM